MGDGAARLTARPGPSPDAPAGPGVHQLSRALLAVPPVEDLDAPLPLVVMLHGATGQAVHSIGQLAGTAPLHGAAVLAPQATDYTWDVLVGGFGPDVAVIDEALAEALAVCPVDPARVAVAGFSDGASYALSIGLANGDLFGHILAFSPGFAAPPGRVGRPRVFVSHGTADPVLPISVTSRRIVPALQAEGYEVEYVEFPGGHTLPADIADAAVARVVGS